MRACRFVRLISNAVIVLTFLTVATQLRADTVLEDRGISMAGPFPVPDITKPPGASAEAVFLAGSVAAAPLYLNELVLSDSGLQWQFSNNGWVGSSSFNINVIDSGRTVWINWDLSSTPYALSYISVNFDNNFYHVYQTSPLIFSDGAVAVTGNQRDVISHIRFFGTAAVPEGSTGAMVLIGLVGIALLLRHRP